MPKNKLPLKQLNTKMKVFAVLGKTSKPPIGWIRAIRSALGMSLQQLGNKLSITKQSMQEIEAREKDGTITLKTLREVAQALDMQLVYGFVPNDGSLEALVSHKAEAVATRIVMRTSNSMKLEGQENSSKRIKQAIKERTAALKEEMPKILWD